ncbi:MAG: hypothetical protein QXE81_00650 [Desulfurococcaceae archaeon]
MSPKVEVNLAIYTDNNVFVDSVNQALRPDNLNPPLNLEISSVVKSLGNNKYTYMINIKTHGDLAHAIKRARSTINEVLAIVKAIYKVFKVVERQDKFLRD